jgi:hypothetical protein
VSINNNISNKATASSLSASGGISLASQGFDQKSKHLGVQIDHIVRNQLQKITETFYQNAAGLIAPAQSNGMRA